MICRCQWDYFLRLVGDDQALSILKTIAGQRAYVCFMCSLADSHDVVVFWDQCNKWLFWQT